ncbi:MAG: hypothetical protein KI786_10390 [Mameliella sp.]|nr:hypothetical protein [Phaeodactylibacter sp.]
MGFINYLMGLPLLSQVGIAISLLLEVFLLYQAVRMYKVTHRFRYAMLNQPYPDALHASKARPEKSRLDKMVYSVLSLPVGILFGRRDFDRLQLTLLYAFIGLAVLSVYFILQLGYVL